MSSSLFRKAKLRLIDRRLQGRRPNRIDPEAEIAPSAQVVGSSIHGRVTVGERARLYRVLLSGPITIGRRSSLWGPRIYVEARGEGVEMGNFCSVARDVSIHGYGHDPQRLSTHYIGRNVLGRPIEEEIVSAGATRIGHDVWIGAGVHILSGVRIGTGAIIGAGSVVTRDIPPYAVAAGVPATAVKYRFEEGTVARLLASNWWNWSDEEIEQRAELFLAPLTPELLDRYL